MAKKKGKNKVTKISPKKVKNLSPGTITYTGKKDLGTRLEIIDFSKDLYERYETTSIPDVLKYKDPTHVTWVNVNGINDADSIKALGEYFEIHRLNLEDIVSIHQRPKINEFDKYIFVVLKMLQYDENGEELITEHLAITVGEDYVLTFQEARNDIFNDLRERIAQNRGRVRYSGADYLLFTIIDAVIDYYYPVLEILENKVEILEDRLFEESDPDMPMDIQNLKKEFLAIRKAIIPLREVLNKLEKSESPIIKDSTKKYFRDAFENITQIVENIEQHREMVWGLMDLYLSTINNKMNEVMKILTIVTSIFIPLTLITGIYGMNFDNMPELHWKYSYYIVLIIMAVIAITLIRYFKKKNWF